MRYLRESWLRQSKLGISPDGLLCFLPQPRRTPAGPDLSSTIPDELLSLILGYLPPTSSRNPYCDEDPTDPLALLLVCRRWHRCYTPVLYRELYIRKIHRPKKLLQTLELRPTFSSYIKALDINIRSRRMNIDVLASIVRHSFLIRKLSLSTDPGEELRPLLEAIARLEYLDSLCFLCSPSMCTIVHQLERPSLRHLELSWYGWGIGDDEIGASKPPNDIMFTIHQAKRLLPLTYHYTGALTSLTIYNPAVPPKVTESIMCWPTALVSFTAACLYHTSFAYRHTPASMERILGRQRHSLKEISLGIMPFHGNQGEFRMLDFSSFCSLETLSMSCHNLFSSEPEATTLQKLSAPLMHHLRISFASESQDGPYFSSFGAEKATWFKNFASAAKSANTALKTIFIEFDPDDDVQYEIDQDHRWPWTYLDEAAQALSESGITMTYSRPLWTSEQWEEEKVQAKIRKAHDKGEHQHQNKEHLQGSSVGEVFCRECQEELEETSESELDNRLESHNDSSSEECYDHAARLD
ncbi:hypothetical protein MMC27_006986 [Xylographa pallens]|nr:hypothetical protein [Xylographa pallens]